MNIYKTLKDYVYEYISEEIRNNNIKPREKINESNICQTLNVSRTPVREALIELASDGILERHPRRGFIVKEVPLEKIREIYKILGVLEGLAGRLSVDNLTEKDIINMEKIVEEIDEAIQNESFEDYYKLQMKFHSIFISASGNSELIRIIDTLKKSLIKQEYNIKGSDKEVNNILKETNSQHKKIIELFKNRDKEGIDNYLRNIHWNLSYAKFDSVWD